MMLRKSTAQPDDIIEVLNQYKSIHHKVLTREDIKALPLTI